MTMTVRRGHAPGHLRTTVGMMVNARTNMSSDMVTRMSATARLVRPLTTRLWRFPEPTYGPFNGFSYLADVTRIHVDAWFRL